MDYQQKIIEILLFMPGFLFSLSCHEASHAYVAYRLGDDTAKKMGRVSLSPIPHIEIIGTLVLPIIGMFSGFLFGWGKPVPVDYRKLKNVKRDAMFIAAAGPASNLVLAIIIAFIFRTVIHYESNLAAMLSVKHMEYIGFVMSSYLILNLALCVFNLIPIQPLDGGKILFGILPINFARKVDYFTTKYGMVILLVLIFSGAFRHILWPPIKIMYTFLLNGF